MKEAFIAGGWGMYPTSLAGLALILTCLLYAFRPESRFVPLIPFKAVDLLQALVTMAGYPSTREPAARHMFQSSGQVLGAIRIRRCTMTNVEGTLVPVAPGDNLVGHNLQSEPSLSGAPLLFTKDTRRVAAIHAGVVANGRLRKAIVINATVHAQVMDWMRRTLAPLPR